MALEIGSRIAHYDVTALIGEGGMGQVYQATDTKLNRQVALKILPEAFATDPDRLARFQREAQVLASLNHPGIAAIYGIEEDEGTRALVLELVEGPTLAERISKGPIPLDEALPIAKQIAEALEAAHEAGVIHRDLKPANIKVREDGTVKVLDFGLAKALDTTPQGDPSESPTLTAAATQMGVIMGTAAYMSPEQARGRPVDKRADIWSFGVVLYEVLTGQRAFQGEDVSMTLSSVLQREPDWSGLPKAVSPSLSVFLHRCLEKDPKQRVPDIAAMRLAMEGAFESPVPAPLETAVANGTLRLWQRTLPAVGIVLAAAALSALGAWSLTRPAPVQLARFVIPLADDQSFDRVDRPVVAISPDGMRVVYAANGALWLRSVDQLEAVAIAGTENARGPFLSPDNQSIGFWADGQLRRVAVNGGAPVTITDAAPVSSTIESQVISLEIDGASWGADNMIVYGHGTGIVRVSAAGGTAEVVLAIEEPEAAHGPQMLPGGDWVLYTLRSDGPGSWNTAEVVAQSLTTGERIPLVSGRDGRYVSTGHLVYARDNTIFAVPFDTSPPEVTGGPVSLVEGVLQAGTIGGAAHFSVANNGALVYVPGGDGGPPEYLLAWMTLDGEQTIMPAPPRTYGSISVSPDGTRIAVDISDGGQRDIWTWRLDQGPLTRLTFDEGLDQDPIWSPDSERVVFYSSRDGGGLFWRAADGTGEVERLLEDADPWVPAAWTADGRLLFARSAVSTLTLTLPMPIGVLTVEGDRTVEMIADGVLPALSSDGQWLAYTSFESGAPHVYVRPFPNLDDGKWQVSTDPGFSPRWSPGGRLLYFLDPLSGIQVVEVETDPAFNPGVPTLTVADTGFIDLAGLGHQLYDLALNGERFFVKVPAARSSDGFTGMIFVEHWFQELTERVPVP